MQHSPFNTNRQILKAESKIVVALERISEAFRVLLWNESKENALSPIQIQILIFLLFHSQEKCKVSYLAQEFNLTKPTISDSIKVLLQKKYIKKAEDERDTRSYSIALTKAGKGIAEKSSLFAGQIERPLSILTAQQKEVMLQSLLTLIHDLNKAGIITLQRMCHTCSHYQASIQGGKHFCKLLNEKLEATDLRIDCPEHEEAPNLK